MYAGTKTYLGGHTMVTSSNLLLWPNLNGYGLRPAPFPLLILGDFAVLARGLDDPKCVVYPVRVLVIVRWGAAAMCYASSPGSSGYDEYWFNNTVILGPASVGSSRGDGYVDFSSCELRNWTDPPTPRTANNTIYTESGNVSANCYGTSSNPTKIPVPFAKWQSGGRDSGSSVLPGKPTNAALVAHAKMLLGFKQL
jgi:hypothetical protein